MQIFGMEDNFWTTGGPGPGGPCSEIYVDRGPEYGKDGGPAADETRFIEIWDLVFENYEVDNVKSKTDLHIVGELNQKNIDTGAGLERLAYLMQGKQNIYETDEVYPVIEAAEQLSGRKYGEDAAADVKFRVVADHVRSALMIMSDGVRRPTSPRLRAAPTAASHHPGHARAGRHRAGDPAPASRLQGRDGRQLPGARKDVP